MGCVRNLELEFLTVNPIYIMKRFTWHYKLTLIGFGLTLMICLLVYNEWNKKSSSDVAEMFKLSESAKTNEVYVETGVAGLLLKQMHNEGRLPGDSKDLHGQLTAETVQLMVSNKVVVMTYPALRTFRVVYTGETSTNNYTLVKQSRDSSWKLQRAWETDSNGQIIKEWPVQ